MSITKDFLTTIHCYPAPLKTFVELPSGHTGLRVRITAGNVRSWVYRYKIGIKSYVLTLGRLEALTPQDAIKEAEKCRAKITLGQNPAEEAQTLKRALRDKVNLADLENPLFPAMAADYIQRHAKPRKKSWEQDQWALNKYVLPAFKHRRIKDITRREVVSLIDAIRDRGADRMAGKVRSLLNSIFTFAIRRGVLEANPVTYTEAPRKPSRSVVLTDDQIRTLWMAEPCAAVLALKMILASGQRPGECAALRWDQLHDTPNGRLWQMDAGTTKNGRAHSVPISHLMAELLEQAATLFGTDTAYVFPNSVGSYIQGDRVAAAMRTIIGEGATNRRIGVRGAIPTAHDLRRTAITRVSKLGYSRPVQNALANHVDSTIGGVYDRNDYLSEKQSALEALAHELRRAVGLNIVEFPRKAGTHHYSIV